MTTAYISYSDKLFIEYIKNAFHPIDKMYICILKCIYKEKEAYTNE